MFDKSFVSIYFLSDRILILQLSSNKKKVKKQVHIPLTEGIIKDYRVKKLDLLSKILATSWDKFHITERMVGIIIPEFATFSKCFKLPNLSISEVDEAVKWQAQEYLPNGLESTIVDWKITKRTDSGIEVMTVAVDKGVLSEYIKAVESAGLFPVKVETPSICMLRHAKNENRGVLVIYMNFGESILVVSEGEKIVGTSVQYSDDFDQLLQTASKMLIHYNEVEVNKVLVGGIDVNLEKVEAVLNRKPQTISLKVDGMTDEDVQRNLIPLSMQYEDAEQPADPATLNLLPTGLVEKYRFEKFNVQAWSITLTITLFVSLSLFVTLGAYLFMSQNISATRNNLEIIEGNVTDYVNPLDEIESVNSVSQNIINIKNASVLPQIVLNQIYLSKPQDIKILKYDLNLDRGEIRLYGISANRKTLIQFKDNLEKLDDVDKVDIPIASFESETNLEFSMTYLYLPISKDVKEKTNKTDLLK